MTDRAVKVTAVPFGTQIRRIYDLEMAEQALVTARRAHRIYRAHLDEAKRRGVSLGEREALQGRLTTAERALDAAIDAAQVAEARYDSARAACR